MSLHSSTGKIGEKNKDRANMEIYGVDLSKLLGSREEIHANDPDKLGKRPGESNQHFSGRKSEIRKKFFILLGKAYGNLYANKNKKQDPATIKQISKEILTLLLSQIDQRRGMTIPEDKLKLLSRVPQLRKIVEYIRKKKRDLLKEIQDDLKLKTYNINEEKLKQWSPGDRINLLPQKYRPVHWTASVARRIISILRSTLRLIQIITCKFGWNRNTASKNVADTENSLERLSRCSEKGTYAIDDYDDSDFTSRLDHIGGTDNADQSLVVITDTPNKNPSLPETPEPTKQVHNKKLPSNATEFFESLSPEEEEPLRELIKDLGGDYTALKNNDDDEKDDDDGHED